MLMYKLQYLSDLTNSNVFSLFFEDLQNTPDDDRHQSEHVALKSVALHGTVCIYKTGRKQRGGHH